MSERLRVRVRGLVQGVGLRPLLHLLATRHQLSGFVYNDEQGVLFEVQGERPRELLAELEQAPPKLARIDSLVVETLPCRRDESGFAIRASAASGHAQTMIGADLAPCAECLDEICTPSARRYLYPFTNCTHCGPRYTITESLPYDRARTTLRSFPLCPACAAEYHDPCDRRFHAQPVACPDCGPRLSHSLAAIVAQLRDGQVVALKGVGGYHLICDATRDGTVRTLRERKARDAKPLAVMVANVASARLLAEVSDEEAALLRDPRRPIVLLGRRPDAPIAPSLAADLSTVGVMLPMSPLHELLVFEWLGRPQGAAWREAAMDLSWVMTSGNRHEQPLIYSDDEARAQLASIADLVVSHDRPIAVRCDDSVVRQVARQGLWIRRARGLVPEPIALPVEMQPLLGLGGELKSTLCLTRGREAFVSQHLGDLGTVDCARAYRETLDHLCKLLDVRPEAVVADRHPDFAARRIVADLGLPIFEVQHHHAHLQAVLAEHGRRGSALGLILDGFGLGDDHTAWGGELLWSDGRRCQRIGHLTPLRQPGGEAAARQPWRLATALLASLGLADEAKRRFESHWPVGPILSMLDNPALSPSTTACGRAFAAASALLGLREQERYEGEAAMVLESQVRRPTVLPDGFVLRSGNGERPDQLDLSPLWRALLACGPSDGADLFHGTLAAGLAALVLSGLRRQEKSEIVLAGGCVINQVLTELLVAELGRQGIAVLLPRRLPPSDAALSLGQVFAVAQQQAEA